MQLSLKYDLPFLNVVITYRGSKKAIPNVLIDTGSGGSIFSADMLAEIGISPDPQDVLFSIRGVGGNEAVFARTVDGIQIGEFEMKDFEIEVGGMDYGFEISGILGMDFLLAAGAMVDLQKLSVEFNAPSQR